MSFHTARVMNRLDGIGLVGAANNGVESFKRSRDLSSKVLADRSCYRAGFIPLQCSV